MYSSFKIFKSALSKDEIQSLQSLTLPMYSSDELLERGVLKDFDKGRVKSRSELILPQVDNPHLIDLAILELSFWDRIITCLKFSYDVSNLSWFASHMLLKKARSYSDIDWHQDIAYWTNVTDTNFLSVLIPTSSTDKNNGCLCYFEQKQSTRLNHINVANAYRSLKIDKIVDEKSVVACPTNVGDIIVHNPLSIHKSFSNKSNEDRNIFAVIFKIEG